VSESSEAGPDIDHWHEGFNASSESGRTKSVRFDGISTGFFFSALTTTYIPSDIQKERQQEIEPTSHSNYRNTH